MLRKSGFSLIEVLIVVAIIAILAAIAFPVYGTVRRRAHETRCLANLVEIYHALEAYKQDNKVYPNPADGQVMRMLANKRGLTKVWNCPLDQDGPEHDTYGELYNYWGYGEDISPTPLKDKAAAKAVYNTGNYNTGELHSWYASSDQYKDGPDSDFPGLVNVNAKKTTIATICPHHTSDKSKYLVLRLDGTAEVVRTDQNDFWTKSAVP